MLVAAATGVWGGIAEPIVLGAMAAISLCCRRALGVAMLVGGLIGLLAGWGARMESLAVTSAAVPPGVVTVEGVARTDSRANWGLTTIVMSPDTVDGRAWDGPPIAVRSRSGGTDVLAGDRVRASGRLDSEDHFYRGRPIAASMVTRLLERTSGATSPLYVIGNALRTRVIGALTGVGADERHALVSGFLIGDVSRLPDGDAEALRRAGLSHFVAVSGSNVALFLGAWWLVGGPLAFGPRKRALYGMAGLAVFVVVTRWEPSVVRAALMAGLVLLGRLIGRPLSPWSALGGAVVVALTADPLLVGSYGFALSVAATAGIIAGAPVWSARRPRVLWTIIGATVSAQLAVAPLLLLWFGSVPLVAPIANLLAAPLVSVATVLGGIGTLLPIPGTITLATWSAGLVLAIARMSADLPQLTVGPALLVLGVLAAGVWSSVVRLLGLLAALCAVTLSVVPQPLPEHPFVAFLDVGQGDAAVFRGATGETVLIDGGPDPLLLDRHFGVLGVERIDLLVVSHRHADHVTGLNGIVERWPVGMIWHADQEGEAPGLDALLQAARAAGVVTLVPQPGDVLGVGEFTVEVLGPRRRYAGPNDMSLVIQISARGNSVLMPGDIEVAAQQELGPVRADVLKVPHQGAATSDHAWLAASAPQVAVISVGANNFGHPSAEVIATLAGAGAWVLRTDRDGTVVVDLAVSGVGVR